MADDQKSVNYITPQGLQKLKEELKQLIQIERPKVVAAVAWAASNGDRSENADYIYGKRRLREIDKRSGQLTKKIEDAHVVDPSQMKSEKIVFGATVVVVDEDGEKRTFQIVGADETNAETGRISWQSPVAKALFGKLKGDEVTINRPAGEWIVEIVSVDYK